MVLLLFLGLRFGSLKPLEPIIQPQPQIERQLQHSRSIQPYQVREGSKSSAFYNIFKLSGNYLDKGSSPRARARSDARKATTSGYAEAWSSNSSKRSPTAAANCLAK